MVEEREVRLRCIEAASRAPIVHQDGPAAGVLEVAQRWAEWVVGSQTTGAAPARPVLGVPKKV